MAGTVTVGCKLPNGLILEHGGQRVTVNGANTSQIIGGHGLTEGVAKDFFEAWMERNKGLQFVQQGFIFAHEKRANTEAEAKDRAKNKTGFEPINPDKLPKGIKKADKE